MRRTAICMIILQSMLCNTIYAQPTLRARIDSILKELPLQKEDTNKVKLFNKLSRAFYPANPDSGVIFANNGLVLAGSLGWKKGVAAASNLLGVHFSERNNYTAALKHYLTSMKLSDELGDKRALAGAIRNIVIIYLAQGAYSRALELNMKALKLAKETNDKREVAYAANNIATTYTSMSNYPKAVEYAFISLKIHEEMGNKEEIARVMSTIGAIYSTSGNYAKSREYSQKAVAAYEQTNNSQGLASATGNIGVAFANEKNYPSALSYMLKALATFEKIGDNPGIAQMMLSIGGIYAAMGDNAIALDYEVKALKMEQELGARPNVCYALGIIGKTYLSLARDSSRKQAVVNPEIAQNEYKGKDIPNSKKERLSLAITFLERSIDSSIALGVMEVQKESYEALADAYRLAGRHESALDAYREFTKIKDSIFSRENETKIVQQQMNYDFGKREDAMKNAAALRYQRQRSFSWMGLGGIVALALFSIFMFRHNKLLSREKQRSDDLLLNILPAEVAGELKDKGTAKARHFDNVTVIFTDFVNFTQVAGQMSAQGLIDELHACFKVFDGIMNKYNIEKIKTIGDAYLAVCGLPSPDPNHAENILRAAVEINTFMADRLSKLGAERTFALRIGIHSGSVVAGIVGVKKFAYDIWGDTVNTAARMEQHGEAGRINISETTYNLVKDKFSCDYRGEVEVKGKGVLKMYFASASQTLV